MKLLFIYASFSRHAQSHPELKQFVPCQEYFRPPSLGIAALAACTPREIEVAFHDDRRQRLEENLPQADAYAFSFFTLAAARAMELARLLKETTGKPLIAGGIFPTMMPELVQKHFDAVVVGEGESVWPEVCADLLHGKLKPLYRSQTPADPSCLKPPRLDLYLKAEDDRLRPDDYPLQLSRGCPFACQCCVLPEVMGKKLRPLADDYVWSCLDTLSAAGKRISLTEDTSLMFVSGARRRFREFLRRLAGWQGKMRPRLSYLGTSFPLLLHAEDELLDDIQAAGINRFYLVCGFDPISRGAFGEGNAEALEKAGRCIQRCQQRGIEPYVSFLAGNDEDGEEIFDRILDFSSRHHINLAEFAVFTPYPGTPAWRKLEAEGRILHRDWSRYNDANVVFRPARMTPERLQEGYLYLWREFYRGRPDLRQAERERGTIQF